MSFIFMLLAPIYYYNLPLFFWINGWNPWLLDPVFGVLSGFGDGLVIALIVAVISFYRLRLGIAGLLAFIVSGLLAQLLKRMFDLPRPPAVFEHVHLLGHALQSHSFPSGHATSCGVMLLLGVLLWSTKSWQAWLFAVPFMLAALGRVYGGVHFPVDVWVGLWMGLLTMWGCWWLSARLPIVAWQASPWLPRILGVIVMIEAGVLGLGYPMQPVTAQPLAAILPPVALFLLWQYWKKTIASPLKAA
ncbi:MAG: phosphatase PAP2 family protein [Mariprofundaceae bacterium]|nr:phosphatase PAP2 family protein [Mariprofundaceae bacterium]